MKKETTKNTTRKVFVIDDELIDDVCTQLVCNSMLIHDLLVQVVASKKK